ncbi:MAG: glycosyltransferase family 87 protein [Candidatus Aquirickettsiella sp.]
MSFKKIYHFLLFFSAVILLTVILMLNFIYPLTLGKTNILYSDFGKFYHSQQLFIQGKNIYTPIYFVKNKINTDSPVTQTKSAHSKVVKLGGNLNPPFFTLISFPLAYLSYPQALLLWTFLSMLAGALGILLLQQKIDRQTFSVFHALLLLIALFSYFPSFVSLQFGQVSFLLLPLLALGWCAARDEKTIRAAIFLALATSLKPFIGLFLFYFLIRKEWRGLCAFFLTLLSCGLIAALFLGFDSYVAYYHACQQIKWAASSWNVSFYGFLLRLLGGIENNVALLPIPGLVTSLYPWVAGLFLLAIMQFLRSTVHVQTEQKVDLDFSVIIVGMLLLSPLGWIYYFPFLSIPILILWQFAKKGVYPIALPLFLMTCLFLSNIPISLFGSDLINTANVLPVFLSSSLYFSVLIGLTGLIFLLRYRLAHNFELYSQPLDSWQGAAKIKQPQCIRLHEDCALSGNTDKNTNAKNIPFERIPPALLLLIGSVVFLPSYQGIGKATVDWLLHGTHYSQQYSVIAYHQD